MLDYLVVGAGPFGCAFARTVADADRTVMLIDRRGQIAGNCADERRDGINVHLFGPHIFHTNNQALVAWLSQFTEWRQYEHRAVGCYLGRFFSLPINLWTMNQVFGVTTPEEARQVLDRELVCDLSRATNLEDWLLSQVGPTLYNMVYREYTEKQWGRSCRDLPWSIAARVPIRLTWDDRYFSDSFQGLPAAGYSAMFAKMIDGLPVALGEDYLARRDQWDSTAKRIVFTGPIDQFFDFEFGALGYRSLRFEHSFQGGDVQGCPGIRFTGGDVPYTRTIEWKHFERRSLAHTWVTREFPAAYSPAAEPYYPVRDGNSICIYSQYESLAAKHPKFLFGGRLASYRYFDMDQTLGAARMAATRALQQEA